jgi:hypothetical protein
MVTAVLAAGVVVLVARGEPDKHAVYEIIKKASNATTPRATVFHQSRGWRVLIIVFIVLLLLLQLPARRMLLLA